MTANHDRRASGFNDQQFHELEIAVRAEVAMATQDSIERHETLLDRLHDGDERMTRIETGMKVNTEATLEMLAAFNAAKQGLRIFGAIGNAIAWTVRKGWPLWGPLAALIAWWKGMPPTDHHH